MGRREGGSNIGIRSKLLPNAIILLPTPHDHLNVPTMTHPWTNDMEDLAFSDATAAVASMMSILLRTSATSGEHADAPLLGEQSAPCPAPAPLRSDSARGGRGRSSQGGAVSEKERIRKRRNVEAAKRSLLRETGKIVALEVEAEELRRSIEALKRRLWVELLTV
mmetsp:Transcript_15529/g.39759  ORF Transcript_15529/g.39759 Transcript_15529/m.39759 type:complete len:165 (-) Transcript_15529:435-929(-)|eukprot:CAMPEP_0174908010 /NCGR_PEP_ID=MMETSP0167-20121228/62998_1 /TAXON_ID=38298 /ORGANISM="Rhodella maculata, Strain CCMP736" /LENGTH=164 /DNA_ID=CAMNT_0016151625 /DNA_START=147 /DNA_END=641 /DNA_ORIENTATION=-